MPKLLIRGYACQRSGWGLVATTLALEISRLGVDVEFWPIGCPDPNALSDDLKQLLVSESDADRQLVVWNCKNPIPDVVRGRKSVQLTMWETDRPPDRAIANLNQMDAVIVPSEYNLVSFAAAGLRVPCFKVPLFAGKEFLEHRSEFPDEETFIFAAAGRDIALSQRKNLGSVATAFLEAFPAPAKVRLNLLASPHQVSSFPRDSRIEITTTNHSEIEICNWLASSHVFVNASHAEGWGFFPLQAMAVGRPVISHLYGGPIEYLKGSWGFEVPDFDDRPASGWHAGNGNWSAPNITSLADRMSRAAYSLRIREFGAAARETAGQFRPCFTAKRLMAVLQSREILPHR